MVASAAVVLPLILDGERPSELDVRVQVTSPPDFPIVEIATVQPVDAMESDSGRSNDQRRDDIMLIPVPKSARDVQSLVSVESSVTVPKSDDKASVEQVSDRWTLQIATFKSKDNTQRLVEKLKKANYAAYSLTTNSLYKVYVGPEFKRETSERMREEIKKKFSLNGIVIKYSVN